MASAPIPVRVRAMEAADTPVKVRPFSSKLMVTRTFLSEFSFAAIRAALVSERSVMVSITIRSASLPALTISENISMASSNERSPPGSMRRPKGPMSRAQKQGLSIFLQADLANPTPSLTTSSTVYPLSVSLKRFAPKVLV